MRWTFPALNPNELVVFFRGLKTDGPKSLVEDLTRLAAETVDPVRWQFVRDQVDF